MRNFKVHHRDMLHTTHDTENNGRKNFKSHRDTNELMFPFASAIFFLVEEKVKSQKIRKIFF